ncbi:MAG TPA: OmpA family protein [Polyangiaceae bacterium]|jgi:outer membrane protein OmpA-like peptidoglycan-associated protein|nr:OmpA family protein [Polyangiaceae bacterium]
MNRLGRSYGYAGITTLTALLLMGCGSTKAAAPQELVDARAAYNRAASGPASQYNPSDLHVAKTSLDRAEQWYAQDPGAPETRTQSYLALRRAQIASAQGETGLAIAQRDQAERALVQAQAQALAQTRADLDQARAQLAESQRNGSAADERAMAVLERQAGAHREARGEVITLPGSLLFQTGKSELSQTARARLDSVAVALKGTDKKIVVEGYTDDTGTDAVNLPLSEARASEVRSYLISRGVPEANIMARGFGPTRPIASNKTVEGRATNRRVEIVVPNSGAAEPMPEDKPQKKQPSQQKP